MVFNSQKWLTSDFLNYPYVPMADVKNVPFLLQFNSRFKLSQQWWSIKCLYKSESWPSI